MSGGLSITVYETSHFCMTWAMAAVVLWAVATRMAGAIGVARVRLSSSSSSLFVEGKRLGDSSVKGASLGSEGRMSRSHGPLKVGSLTEGGCGGRSSGGPLVTSAALRRIPGFQ